MSDKADDKTTADPGADSSSSDPSTRKSAAELLKEAMAAKKAAAGGGKGKLRADFSNAKGQRDAERRAGKSRKVH